MSPKTSYKREQVVEIIGSVVKRISNKSLDDTVLLRELQSLKDAVHVMRSELNAANPGGIQQHIPSATDELDAIVGMTEAATHEIIEACEAIQSVLKDKVLEESAVIESEIIRIVEACTFQDLTGQRISKILKSLKEIDRCANELSTVLSERFADLNAVQGEEIDPANALLNGPALPGQAISQEEIDRLLEDF